MAIQSGLTGTKVTYPFSWESPSGISIEASVSANDGLLTKFFAGYDKAFVLPNEKERLDGFADCLSLNEGESYRNLCNLFGPFREFIFLATDSRTGVQLGGGNLIAFPIIDHENSAESVLSVNLNYIFVNQEVRGRGYFTRLIRDLPAMVVSLFSRSNPDVLSSCSIKTVIFIEQNDPFKMGREEYERDTLHAGIDQIHRIGTWARRGAKIVDFDYAQPALTANQEPDYNLVYGVLGVSQDSLESCLLFEHLRRFFGISVLKGKDPSVDLVARKQLDALAAMCASRGRINLLSVDETKLRQPEYKQAAGKSLRDVLKSSS